MSELQVPKCSCYVQGEVNAVFTRPCLCPNRATESLIAAAAGELVPLEGARERRGLLIGPAFSPTFVSQPGGALPSTCLYAPCYDPFSNSVFAAPGHAIVRLTADNHVRLIAGSVQVRQLSLIGERRPCSAVMTRVAWHVARRVEEGVQGRLACVPLKMRVRINSATFPGHLCSGHHRIRAQQFPGAMSGSDLAVLFTGTAA